MSNSHTVNSNSRANLNSNYSNNPESNNSTNYILNEHGIPVPTIEHIQNMLGSVTSIDQLEGKGNVLGKLFEKTINSLLQGEIENHLGYSSNQKTGISKTSGNSRNGYTSKKLKTDMGQVMVDTPRDRLGSFQPQIVKKNQTSTKGIEQKIIALYAMGNTTSEISDHLEEIYGFEVSPQYISLATEKVLPLVKDWQNRPLEPIYPIVFLDCIRYKIRDGGGDGRGIGGRVINKAVYVLLGISITGKKDVLGLYTSENESAKFWMNVLSDIRERGVQDILICPTDNLTGFNEAITSIFPNTKHQKCIVHQIRNSTKFVSYKDLKPFTKDLKTIYTAKDELTALENFEKVKEVWNHKYSYAIKSWETNWNELMTFMEYPKEIRTLIYTTNPIEGLNRQLRKVTKKRASFPTDNSLFKCLFLAIQNIQKKWTLPIRNWSQIINQLTIIFEDRITKYINP